MEERRVDEWYEILDELNIHLEELFNGCDNPRVCELLIPRFRQKVQEFLLDVEHEKEMLENIKIGV
ncbi:hypothetical protein LLG96_18415 [bacterium]|nr:hypothetical protein [bacterium]